MSRFKQSNVLNDNRPLKHVVFPFFFIIISIILYAGSTFNYLLFHCSIEFFGIIVSCSVFIVSTFTYEKDKNAFSVLGIGYLSVGIFDFLHTLSFEGMPVFADGMQYAQTLWICARGAEAVTIILFLVFTKYKIRFFPVIAALYMLFVFSILFAVFKLHFFVKAASFNGEHRPALLQCSICLLFAAAFLLTRFGHVFDNKKIREYFSWSLFTAVLSDICFVLPLPGHSILQVCGLILKVISFFYIYRSILLVNVKEPLSLIFEQLNSQINESRSLNERLMQSEKKYKAISEQLERIMDNVPGLVFYKDKENKYLKVNKYLADAHSKKKEELENQSLFDLYDNNDAELYYRDDLEVISSGKAKMNIEERWVTETGVRWINVNKIPCVDINGAISGIIGIAMDITDRKQSEEKIMKLLSELETEKNAALKTSLTDGLTGIYNRRYFNEMLQKEIATAKRHKRDLSLAMVDIDYFKNYNDLYGHVKGDECLRNVVTALQKVLRRGMDTLIRYGGEEFIAIFENTDRKNAVMMAERMRKAVYNLKQIHEDSKCAEFVTVSVGVATLNDFDIKESDDLVVFADMALYRAKNGGRNRVTLFDGNEIER